MLRGAIVAQVRSPEQAEIHGIQRRWHLVVETGFHGLCLRKDLGTVLAPGEHRLDRDEKVMICCDVISLRLSFDDLHSADAKLIEISIEAMLEQDAPQVFYETVVVPRESVSAEDLVASLMSDMRQSLRDELHCYREGELRKADVRGIVAERLKPFAESWSKPRGLKVTAIRIAQLDNLEEKLATLEEIRQVKDRADLLHKSGQMQEEDILRQLRHENVSSELHGLLETVGTLSELVAEIDKMRAGLKDKEERRCQLCGRVRGSEELVWCADCGRQVCTTHLHATSGLCERCESRREKEDLLICAGCGAYEKKERMFECRKCKKTYCKEYCFDPAGRVCVVCSLPDKEAGYPREAANLSQLVSGTVHRRQPFFTRVWCDTARPVTRGIEVVPSTDIQRFRIGQQLRFDFWSDRDCFLQVVAIQSDGKVVQLFPNPWHRDNFVQGGKELRIPSETMRFRYRATAPAGVDTIAALAALERFELLDVPDASKGAPRKGGCGEDYGVGLGEADAVSAGETLTAALKRLESSVYACAVCKIMVHDDEPGGA